MSSGCAECSREHQEELGEVNWLRWRLGPLNKSPRANSVAQRLKAFAAKLWSPA